MHLDRCYIAARPVILEPVMMVELKVPTEFQGTVASDINKRKGVIVGNDQDGNDSVITAHGKGEFTMEYKEHSVVSNDVQTQLVNTYKGTNPAD
ncbi:elongation factor G-1, mitochondrial-like [Quercus suber]|uniref:elongation factor G-1, mitochondrial-like n=1 Tax=Quercus suber TaxID=58331 RepID=UPI000D2E5830|nr:elongation factor g-1, mitochondrial [Quercus suber]